MPKAHVGFALVSSAALALAFASCSAPARQVVSEWPPQDFRFTIEALAPGPSGPVVTRRFDARADGVCVYAVSAEPLVDPVSRVALPVFETLCVYRLRPECVRLLARRLHQRGIASLETLQGAGIDAPEQSALRLSHRAFGHARTVVAAGQVHGALVRVLHVANAYLPPGASFALPGMVGDPEPVHLTGLPQPTTGAFAALGWFEEQAEAEGADADTLLAAFALSCRTGDRARAVRWQARWTALASIGATSDAPFYDPPRLLHEMLDRMLPP